MYDRYFYYVINNILESDNANKEDSIKPFCMYCKKFQTQFAKHILRHSNEELVKMYINEKNSKQKAKILSYIRNKGSGLLEKMTGKVKPVKRLRKGVITLKVLCDMCDGRFSKETLWKHRKYCFGNNFK